MSWADAEAGKRGLSVAQLSDGETAAFQLTGEPYRQETAESPDALHIPVNPLDVPDGFADMSGDTLQEDMEYVIINSSSGFYQALCAALGIEPGEGYDGSLEGQHMTVEASQPGDTFSRTYSVSFD